MKRCCALLIVVATGCGTVSPRPDVDNMSYGIQAFDDLPVPQDFRFDDSDASWAYRRYENSPLNLRCGQFRYVGDRDVGQLVNWYRQQMPEHKWEQVSTDLDPSGRKATVTYNRGSEAAVVRITREEIPSRPAPFTVIVLEIGVASAVKPAAL